MLKAYRFGKPLLRITEFMRGEAAGGFVLMATSALALLVANSPFAETYFRTLDLHFAGLSVLHWINDGLMAVFFLLVGLEIKREARIGQLATWPQRALPGIAAFGGMLVPALIFVTFNRADETALRGWAIPTATDIAFALGVLALLGRHVPVSLKVFLTALAIIDDLGAVLIIAFFYSSGLSLSYLALAAGVVLVLALLNRGGVRVLWPYLLLGVVLWFLVLRSGVHATLAGVVLALCIPLGSGGEDARAPLLRLEHGLARVVPFIIIPVFGFANAGLALGGVGMSALFDPLTLGIALGLLIGKFVGVLGFSAMAIRFGLANLPFRAGWAQMAGIALLCGIGFTMSLFISLLAYSGHPMLGTEAKLGILAGSMLAGLLGYLVLRVCSTDPAARDEDQD